MKQLDVKRSTVTLDPDRTHVLARPFRLMSDQRSIKISARLWLFPKTKSIPFWRGFEPNSATAN